MTPEPDLQIVDLRPDMHEQLRQCAELLVEGAGQVIAARVVYSAV